MLEWLADPAVWVAFLTLTALEVVLGIDNIVFLSILADKLRPDQRLKARRVGLGLAMLMRVGLVMSVAWIVSLTAPVFTLLDHGISWRDIVLIGGGLFLLAKSTHEIHGALEGAHGTVTAKVHASFASVITQILLLDLVFSVDSVITAVGLTQFIPVMVAAVIIGAIVMMVAAGAVSKFVSDHPTIKMLALSFLILIGALLVAEGFGQHIDHGYVYFAMAFAIGVEMLNMRIRRTAKPVELHTPYTEAGEKPVVEGALEGAAGNRP